MSIIEFIRDRARYYSCPVCGRSLRGCDVRMLSHVDDRYTVQVTCGACHVTFIVVLVIQGAPIEALGDVDLELELDEIEDQPAGEAAEPIEADELLDLHLLLKDFQGSFRDLLREPDPKLT
jgi:hypothetical protein